MKSDRKLVPVVLIEHGQTRYDHHDWVHGNRDIPLDDKGREQARALGQSLRKMPEATRPAHLFSSPLKRASETARIAGKIAGIPVTVVDGLKSLDVGRFSGQDEKEVADKLRPYFARPWEQIPGGESVSHWRARWTKAMRRVAARAAEAGKPMGVVSHSNTLGAIEAKAGGGEDGRKAMASPPKSATARPIKYPLPKGT